MIAIEQTLFERHQELVDKGYVITTEAVNQIDNGYQEAVKKGNMPLITFTAYIFKTDLEDYIDAVSADTMKDALSMAIELVETKLLKEKG